MNKKGKAKAKLSWSFFPHGKKGMAAKTIGSVILLIAGGIIGFLVFSTLVGTLSPTIAGFGCGLNMRIDAAVLDNSRVAGKPLFGSPIFICNQYRNPVDISANNFNACPGISDFCKDAKKGSQLQVECWKQCARIQIDKLTDSCWTMAGSGRLNYEDSWLKGFSGLVSNPWALGAIVFTGGAAYYIAGPFLAGFAIGGEIALGSYYSGSGQKILKCYRFRIVDPIVSPIDKKPIDYFDDELGRSWSYGLNSTDLQDPRICKLTKDDPICSYGGTGVTYMNELGEIKYKINDKDITVPKDDVQFYQGITLNYNISDPRNQICYIAYHQANTNPEVEKAGGGRVKLSGHYVIRSCESWSAFAGSANYIN